jgi:hypothetical protein
MDPKQVNNVLWSFMWFRGIRYFIALDIVYAYTAHARKVVDSSGWQKIFSLGTCKCIPLPHLLSGKA